MLIQSIYDRYFSILKSYITRPEEEHLSAAMELGRELVMEDIPTEEIAELHDVALRRLAQEFPDRTLLDVAHLITSPLMEILVAYGLVHRERNKRNIRIEKALRDREERYRKLFEEAPVMYLITHDQDGVPTIADCNKKFLNTLGYTRAEVQEKPLADFYTPESRAKLLEGGGYKRALEGSFIAEERHLTARDGRVIETLLRAVPETYSYGNVRCSLAMYVDVTEQKRAEEALKESERLLRNVLDGLGPHMLVGLMTSEGALIEANRPALEVAGLRPEDVLGKPFEETYWWSYSEPVKQQLRDAIHRAARGETCRYDVIVRVGEKRFITIDFCIQPLIDEAGRIIYLIPSAVDITERKLGEETLRRSEASLAEAQHIAHLGSWDWDIVNNESHWSDEVYRIFGLKPQEIDATYKAFMNFVHPDDREFVEKSGRAALYENKPYGINHRIVLPNAEVRIVHEQAKVIFDDFGKPIRMVGTMQDITERKRMEEELQHSLHMLRRAVDGTVQVIASTVEIRDPYTAGHQKRVADLARTIPTKMGLPSEQINGIRMAGVIHDLGKLTVPAEILSKPGSISETEFDLIKTHPLVGYKILKDVEFPWPVAEIVLQHHERMNGSGYPSGLSGENIIIEARILAVADVAEAMASHRPYRPALGIDKALEEISENSGILYDPMVVDACLECITEKGFKFQ